MRKKTVVVVVAAAVVVVVVVEQIVAPVRLRNIWGRARARTFSSGTQNMRCCGDTVQSSASVDTAVCAHTH